MTNVKSQWCCPEPSTDEVACERHPSSRCQANNWNTNIQIARDLIVAKMHVCAELLGAMNRDWLEPVCNCSPLVKLYFTPRSETCRNCNRKETRPDTSFGKAWVAYEVTIRLAEETLKLLAMITDPRGIPNEELLKRSGHDLSRCWNSLPRCVRRQLDPPHEGSDRFATALKQFAQDEFNTIRYAWTDFAKTLPRIKTDLMEFYALYERTVEVVEFIDKNYDATPSRDRGGIVEADSDYHHPPWVPPRLPPVSRRDLRLSTYQLPIDDDQAPQPTYYGQA